MVARVASTKMTSKGKKPEQLLRRAYNLSGSQEALELYRDWAETYDDTMVNGLEYLTPRRTSLLLSNNLDDRHAKILDVGSGTGLAGECLASLGLSTIDALDYSAEMLAVAARKKFAGKKIYNATIEADLNEILPFEDEYYDALICTGTFTHAHVGANCLGELFRVLRPGGLFACTIHRDVWEAAGFLSESTRLMDMNILGLRDMTEGKYFASDKEPQGWFILWEKIG